MTEVPSPEPLLGEAPLAIKEVAMASAEPVLEEVGGANEGVALEENAEASEEMIFEETVEAAAEEATTVLEGAGKATEEVVQPSSPTAASGETGPILEPTLAPVENAALDQSNQVSDPTAPLASPPEGLQLILWVPPLRLGRAGRTGEVPPAVPTEDSQPLLELSPLQPDPTTQAKEVETETACGTPPPTPEIEAAVEVEPTTPAPTRTSGEASSSLGTRAARLRARTTPPADPEPIRLARAFFTGYCAKAHA